MRNIQDTIKKLSAAHIREIKNILRVEGPAKNIAEQIYTKLLSYSGMADMIQHLSPNERKILQLAHKGKNGITYEELGRNLELDNDKIEKYTTNLTNRLLVYVLKNRQKLSNKLDKVYLLPEIYDVLKPLNDHQVNNNFSDIYKFLSSKETDKKSIKQITKIPAGIYVDPIFNSGGILSLEEFKNHVPGKSLQKILTDLLKDKYIHIFHDLFFSGKTFILLDKRLFIHLAEKEKKTDCTPINVRNGYNTLLNLLKTYDTVSTYGLFLTKQNHFRKIDKKHLEESMVKIYDINGTIIDPSVVSLLSLYYLYMQDCITITNSSVIISLKKVKDIMNDPLSWLDMIIKLTGDTLKHEPLFRPSLEIPEIEKIFPVIDLIRNNNNKTLKYIEAAYFAKAHSRIKNNDFLNFLELRQNNKKLFHLIMNYLCITGIIDIENSRIRLSDIGKKFADKEIPKDKKIPGTASEKKNIKNVYLNPDFTLIIPKKEISSEALYHILAHTEIIKDDIILHTRISRGSTLTALKREMTNNKFFSTLKKNLKTEIPDNLNFLISEWANQTIRMNIFNACIINTNNSFLDKISHSKIKNCIVKRLANEYAIIDRKYLDRLIRMAKENDAIINLFDEFKKSGDGT